MSTVNENQSQPPANVHHVILWVYHKEMGIMGKGKDIFVYIPVSIIVEVLLVGGKCRVSTLFGNGVSSPNSHWSLLLLEAKVSSSFDIGIASHPSKGGTATVVNTVEKYEA